MIKYTYLLVDFFTVLMPLAFSFHPKLNFYKTWWAFFPAVSFVALCFLVWDAYFTSLGVWGFNKQYLTGIMIGNLPIEELLFFLCIPYACVFTFHCLGGVRGLSLNGKFKNATTLLLLAGLITIGILNFDRLYTSVTFISLAILLAITNYWLKIKWLGKFYVVYTILLLPFLIVNGILTGTGLDNPVVWYNESEIIGLRILTIPVEDIFYGMELVLLNLLIYRYLISRYKAKHIKKQVLEQA
jgi:lycopene cyclase domain-containing protein